MTTTLDIYIYGQHAEKVAALFTHPAIRAVALPGESLPTSAPASDALVAYLDASEFPSLAPKKPHKERRWILEHVRAIDPAALASRVDAIALRAGLLQLHDFLDESHSESQSIEGEGRSRAGDYWHGIMHRREPDYGNAKYWFRRVGPHPIFTAVAEQADAILANRTNAEAATWRGRLVRDGRWDPMAMVDLCEACRHGQGELERAAREIQFAEMLLLLERTFADAVGA